MRFNLGDAALAVCIGSIVAVSILWSTGSLNDRLPYTEPHHTFTTDDGIECAAWRFDNGAAVALCEGQGLVLVSPKRECGLVL